jgi:DNA-binding MarR family transcriptional regulator
LVLIRAILIETLDMHDDTHTDQKETGPTLLELVLQVHGDLRRSLMPLRVTPLQAGVLLFLRRHAEGRVTDAAATLRVRQPTLSEVVNDLVRKGWVTKRPSVTDTRVVCLRLSEEGKAMARWIAHRVRQVEVTLTEDDRGALGRTSPRRRV